MADSLARIYNLPFLKSGEKTARIIVCADGDILMNDVNEHGPLPLGFSKDINYTFANGEFLSNCLDYCVNPSGILEARSKDYSLRMLDPEKTDDQRGFWQFMNIASPLLLIVVCGLIFQYIRKKKYSSGTL
jgi:ABC-2 type transport system permease protein